MILVDSSVWIDHFRFRNQKLTDLIDGGQMLVHPVVIGELLLGGLPGGMILRDLQDMPRAESVEDGEVLLFIQRHGLTGCGVGYGDAHLLASTRLTPGAALWTRDRRLLAATRRLGLDADIEPYGGVQED
jgi:predicted nucleic acid-binding protein